MSDDHALSPRISPLPPEAFGDDGDDFGGADLALFDGKGGTYTAGRDKDELPVGTKAVAIVDEQLKGFTRFDDGKARSRMVPLWPIPDLDALRASLGDLDPELWPTRDARGKPQDVWRKARKLPIITLDTTCWHLVYATSSFGGVKAVSQLSRATQMRRRDPDHAGALPIVSLEVESYAHPNKAFGRIYSPLFDIIAWTSHAALAEALRRGNCATLLLPPSARPEPQAERQPVAPRRSPAPSPRPEPQAEPVASRRSPAKEAAQHAAAPRDEDPAAGAPSASAEEDRSAAAAQARLAEFRNKRRHG